ncbi:hypothetical protein LMH87_002665 [Akanthomyces muscarius]|uniref:Extracellular soluble lytic transglycosylase n=1 Tax=Akanthomyces muscarius TaxID=2231603 RepID=A0A9W8Q777_AKAMU|nr:hypothetical protein LMH87_002665 [Akanthomyces muscarius]KAJ4148184.1 hypothetical protein LMH87_002665 [Akanthomyces muscarius]
MHLVTYISTALMAVGMAHAARRPKFNVSEPKATNPQAQGACNTTRGGEQACGPNGSEAWFNTGLETDEGWQPPYLNVSSVVTISLDDFWKGVGKRCYDYRPNLVLPGREYNINPVILAALALQESDCDSLHRGYGLTRCVNRNCPKGSSNNGKCQYPLEINGQCAARNLRQWLDGSNGNILVALGKWDSWFIAGSGLNRNKGFTAEYPCSDEGKVQNALRRDQSPPNLSWLHDTLNGWFQGHNMSGPAKDLRGKFADRGNCTN